MNQNQQNKIQFNCNVCFSQPGMYLTVCTCIYCKDCLKELDFNKTECKVCKKNFDIKKTLDMSRPEQVRNIEFIFDNFENQLKRTLECYKFQNNQNKKYIKFLEEGKNRDKLEKQALHNKIEALERQLKMYSTSSSKNFKSSVGKLNDSSFSTENNSNNIIDIKSIKSIVPKRNSSMTNSSKLDKNNYSNIKVENLNVRTAENMKVPNINTISLKSYEGYCTPKPIVNNSTMYSNQNYNNPGNQVNSQINCGKFDKLILVMNNPNINNNNYKYQKRNFEQSTSSNNKINAVYEYEDTGTKCAVKRPKYY